ncbi:MAG: hypothetical protein WDA75_22880 [Candidatus Latescibacterota bacterium]|jgi:hypothetical protein
MDLHQIERKQRRGKILRALNQIYPRDLLIKTLVRILEEAKLCSSTEKVESDLAYLADKEYLETSKITDEGEDVTLARLTAHGKDLIEGNICADVGVEF